MNTKHHAFSVRLRECLYEIGIRDHAHQMQAIAAASSRSMRTADRYLRGKSSPQHLDDHLCGLADFLGVLPFWLSLGKGPRTQESADNELAFIMKVRTMPKYYQNKLNRALLLMINGSKREQRLRNMEEAGQISPRQYLDQI